MSLPVTLVPTGIANLASVQAALRRAGATPLLAQAPADLATAPAVLLPGVGDFGAGMAALRERGFAAPLRARLLALRPTLAICLGMQLCAAGSDEAPGVAGLGVLPARAEPFPPGVRAPQMGWNAVTAGGPGLLRPGHAWFANSYRLTEAPPEWLPAFAEHGGRFLAGCERGPLLLCQFHPELSGAWGEALLGRWLAAATEAAPC